MSIQGMNGLMKNIASDGGTRCPELGPWGLMGEGVRGTRGSHRLSGTRCHRRGREDWAAGSPG